MINWYKVWCLQKKKINYEKDKSFKQPDVTKRRKTRHINLAYSWVHPLGWTSRFTNQYDCVVSYSISFIKENKILVITKKEETWEKTPQEVIQKTFRKFSSALNVRRLSHLSQIWKISISKSIQMASKHRKTSKIR